MSNINQNDNVLWGGDEERRGESPAAPQEPTPQQAGSLVTPGLQISGPSAWEFLAANIDTLDMSFYVDWGANGAELFEELEKGKIAARDTGAASFREGETMILPTAGKKFFSWHLMRTEFHLFLSGYLESTSNRPNVAVSISARTLWENGPYAAIQMVVEWVNQLGGSIIKGHVSRLDVAADFVVDGGISYEFIKQHAVTRSEKKTLHEAGDVTETVYIGELGSPLMLRIYDKTRELEKSPAKAWLREIWGDIGFRTVYRIEFQLRREVLREFGINALDEIGRVAGLWIRLTNDWFSIRNLDNQNTTRRSTHPFWKSVQAVGKKLGEIKDVKRRKFENIPDLERNLAQAMGHLKSFAGLTSHEGTFEEVALSFVETAKARRLDQSFQEDVKIRRIKQGVPLRKKSDSDIPAPEKSGEDNVPRSSGNKAA